MHDCGRVRKTGNECAGDAADSTCCDTHQLDGVSVRSRNEQRRIECKFC